MYHPGMYQRMQHSQYRMPPQHQLPRHQYSPHVRYQGDTQQPNKRRKVELNTDDKRFLGAFQQRVGLRRKDTARQTVAQTLEKLGNVYKLLEKCKDNLSDVDVAKKLEESSAQVTKVCTKQNMSHLKKIIVQRHKKKVNNAEKRNAKIAALALEIDHWRATMLAQDKKKKEDDELCSTAGNTLQQVLQKQRQTKRLLDTVKLLVDLRDIRKQQSARRHGTFVEPEVDQRFDRNVSKIKEVIKEKLETFYAEEKTIKVLMDSNEADIWGVEKKLRQLEHIPDNVIDYSSVYLEIQYNPRKLVEIRREWDEYLCAPGTPAGTRIPTTTLLPPSNPSPQWGQYLRVESSHSPSTSHQPPPPPMEPIPTS